MISIIAIKRNWEKIDNSYKEYKKYKENIKNRKNSNEEYELEDKLI